MLAMFCTLNANAGKRILFTENYENAASVADTKWSTPANGEVTIASDEFGKFFSFFLGQNNGRSVNCLWGHDIYEGVETDIYDVTFDFSIATTSNNQYNSNITVFTGETCELTNGQHTTTKEWGAYAALSENWLFDMAQVQRASDDTNTNPLYYMNGDENDEWSPEVGAWYTITVSVNKTTRVAEYSIANMATGAVVKSGSHTVSAEGNINASGICAMAARYQTKFYFDNVTVSVPVDGDYANKPVVALTGIMNTERTYTISFLEGETLVIEGVDGTTKTHDYLENFGSATYTTSTSGTFTAYTTAGSETSEKVETEVDASIIQVPAATASIAAVETGFGKTYTLTVDNKEVPLTPTIFINYTFKDENGTVQFSKEGVSTGAQVTLPGFGTLEIETEAYGYGANKTTVVNNIGYKIAEKVDFQHMTAEELTDLGFTELDPLISSKTSGDTNWTGRRRLYFDQTWPDASTETGDSIHRIYVYGPSDEEWINGGNAPLPAIRCFEMPYQQVDSAAMYGTFAPVYVWQGTESNGANLHVKLGIGLICNVTALGNAPMGVSGYDENAFVVVSTIVDYGTTSEHPVFEHANAAEANAAEEADIAKYKAMNLGGTKATYKGNEKWNLYRIQDAVTCVEIYVVDEELTGISNVVTKEKVLDPNAPIYNLRGMQVNKNAMQRGNVYIQNGKKFLVK